MFGINPEGGVCSVIIMVTNLCFLKTNSLCFSLFSLLFAVSFILMSIDHGIYCFFSQNLKPPQAKILLEMHHRMYKKKINNYI